MSFQNFIQHFGITTLGMFSLCILSALLPNIEITGIVYHNPCEHCLNSSLSILDLVTGLAPALSGDFEEFTYRLGRRGGRQVQMPWVTCRGFVQMSPSLTLSSPELAGLRQPDSQLVGNGLVSTISAQSEQAQMPSGKHKEDGLHVRRSEVEGTIHWVSWI